MVRWWKGPDWLSVETETPITKYELDEETHVGVNQDTKKESRLFQAGLMVGVNASLRPFGIDDTKISKLSRLIRLTARCQQFVSNLKATNFECVLSPYELSKASEMWTKHIQHKHSPDVLKAWPSINTGLDNVHVIFCISE